MTSLTSNSKLCKFITSPKMIKKEVKFWPQYSFNIVKDKNRLNINYVGIS